MIDPIEEELISQLMDVPEDDLVLPPLWREELVSIQTYQLEWGLHCSQVDRTQVAFCPPDQRAKGVFTRGRVGRLLKRLWPELPDHKVQALVHAWTAHFTGVGEVVQPWKEAVTGDEIVAVYDAGPQSCAALHPYDPVRAYAYPGNGLALAYLGDLESGEVSQRAFIRKDLKVASCVYGSGPLGTYLEAAGYQFIMGWAEDLKMAKIKFEDGWLAPWVDDKCNGSWGKVHHLHDMGDHFVVGTYSSWDDEDVYDTHENDDARDKEGERRTLCWGIVGAGKPDIFYEDEEDLVDCEICESATDFGDTIGTSYSRFAGGTWHYSHICPSCRENYFHDVIDADGDSVLAHEEDCYETDDGDHFLIGDPHYVEDVVSGSWHHERDATFLNAVDGYVVDSSLIKDADGQQSTAYQAFLDGQYLSEGGVWSHQPPKAGNWWDLKRAQHWLAKDDKKRSPSTRHGNLRYALGYDQVNLLCHEWSGDEHAAACRSTRHRRALRVKAAVPDLGVRLRLYKLHKVREVQMGGETVRLHAGQHTAAVAAQLVQSSVLAKVLEGGYGYVTVCQEDGQWVTYYRGSRSDGPLLSNGALLEQWCQRLALSKDLAGRFSNGLQYEVRHNFKTNKDVSNVVEIPSLNNGDFSLHANLTASMQTAVHRYLLDFSDAVTALPELDEFEDGFPYGGEAPSKCEPLACISLTGVQLDLWPRSEVVVENVWPMPVGNLGRHTTVGQLVQLAALH